ncbi:hypothetical protein [Acidithiobacillus ferrooxidans]|uniref:Uncharacterized protein n=1 Tax=Acidithiobacillus ferrooxidans TaxID=920 RepID=A0A2W1KR99_ACIFR|nr:hypothetical protein [Acidithiobacillus ferrooxidans]MBU2816533.1 hypothetical protein [Acidithiobacillus ferrooxidans]MCR1341719.1 hypothetical protein [Acidithiobacillus ferrooxidans]PZD81851.1 hypothetical protein DN052_01890 [Acidithiobacillus ferrooxidans]QLK41859.1 hypothetical protein FE661_06605 [Acidithiobacillus ferrooxidans]QZT53816.1 hypothetical protein K7B00_06570 [Acidithiobacillus ferrooxidans]
MLTLKDILDKHSVADYAVIYLGARRPSSAIDADIRYCVEESPTPELCKDRNGNVMIFDSEAQAFDFRKALGIPYPVLAFHDQPLPDFGPDLAPDMDEPAGSFDDEYGIDIPDIEAVLS